MKPVSDKMMDNLEDAALEGVKHLKAFFAYEGKDPVYYQKAKMGAMVIGGYSRVRASETNRMAVELSTKKLLDAGTKE